MFRRVLLPTVLAAGVLIPSLALTQEPPNRGGPGPGPGPGGPPGFDINQIRERMLGFYREQLDVTDEEWKVLSPKVERVMTAQGEILMGSMGGFGGFGFGRRGGPGGPGGGPGGPFANLPEGKIAKARRELREALDNKDAGAAELTRKLEALREARKKAQEELAAAQKDLKELVTPRQEATLVLLNLLE
ncbi:MAG: hypothetical protein HRF43_12430 [Phycisphaerae bacterium]|jgi:hypothetical protein